MILDVGDSTVFGVGTIMAETEKGQWFRTRLYSLLPFA